MDNVKVNLTILVPGTDVVSEQGRSKEPTAKDYDKNVYDRHTLHLKDGPISFFTKKRVPAKQVLNISKEAYDAFVSDEVPYGYNFNRVSNVPWKNCNKETRLIWHLNRICESMCGTLDSYTVFED